MNTIGYAINGTTNSGLTKNKEAYYFLLSEFGVTFNIMSPLLQGLPGQGLFFVYFLNLCFPSN